jgi:type II secretory pathway component GspD/PulD (secretin)
MRKLAVAAFVAAFALQLQAEEPDRVKHEIMNKLESTKISLDFRDTSLDEVMDFLHEVTGINFVMSKNVLEKVRGGEIKINIQLNEITLKTALRLMLDLQDLTLVYQKGVLIVETKEDHGAQVKMRMYDVKDLLMKINDFPGPQLELSSGEEGDSPTTGFIPEETERPFDDPESLVQIIRNATGGDATWSKDNASIAISSGLLIVVQSDDVQKEVAQLITSLRQFK